jgi:hypothetical protein
MLLSLLEMECLAEIWPWPLVLETLGLAEFSPSSLVHPPLPAVMAPSPRLLPSRLDLCPPELAMHPAVMPAQSLSKQESAAAVHLGIYQSVLERAWALSEPLSPQERETPSQWMELVGPQEWLVETPPLVAPLRFVAELDWLLRVAM